MQQNMTKLVEVLESLEDVVATTAITWQAKHDIVLGRYDHHVRPLLRQLGLTLDWDYVEEHAGLCVARFVDAAREFRLRLLNVMKESDQVFAL